MNILPIAILAAGAYFVVSKSNNTKSVWTPKAPSLEGTGFIISDDCKKFIISDRGKALKWAFNEGKIVANSSVDPQKATEFFGTKCKGKEVDPTEENLLFEYEMTASFVSGLGSKLSTSKYMLFIALWIVYFGVIELLGIKNSNFDINKFTIPSNLPIFSSITQNRGYTLTSCNFTVIDKEKMSNYAYNLSKAFSIKVEDIVNKLSILESIFYDNCLMGENLTQNDYVIFYNFLKGQVDNKSISKNEANVLLSNLQEAFKSKNIDITISPLKF